MRTDLHAQRPTRGTFIDGRVPARDRLGNDGGLAHQFWDRCYAPEVLGRGAVLAAVTWLAAGTMTSGDVRRSDVPSSKRSRRSDWAGVVSPLPLALVECFHLEEKIRYKSGVGRHGSSMLPSVSLPECRRNRQEVLPSVNSGDLHEESCDRW
jgi:hypothetical protein